MPLLLRRALTGLLVVLAQWLVFGRLRLWGAFPDLVLLYVALQAVQFGRLAGTAAGFGTGLLMDVLYGTWGLHMTLKTVIGFVVGFFRSDQGEYLRLAPPVAFLGGLVVALVHHGLMVIVLALDQDTRTLFLVTGLWLGSALYTAFIALLAALYRSR
ncbi:MAG TPA: rod shape-determining protein MreD [Rubricoccaceae bacterium]|nr:rod shape-determining protein MreD [Rubricoccaceae bacterium]